MPWQEFLLPHSCAEKLVRTLNCRIIFVDEMALDELDGKARFTDATASNHDQLVLSQELRCKPAKLVTGRQLQKAEVGGQGPPYPHPPSPPQARRMLWPTNLGGHRNDSG